MKSYEIRSRNFSNLLLMNKAYSLKVIEFLSVFSRTEREVSFPNHFISLGRILLFLQGYINQIFQLDFKVSNLQPNARKGWMSSSDFIKLIEYSKVRAMLWKCGEDTEARNRAALRKLGTNQIELRTKSLQKKERLSQKSNDDQTEKFTSPPDIIFSKHQDVSQRTKWTWLPFLGRHSYIIERELKKYGYKVGFHPFLTLAT